MSCPDSIKRIINDIIEFKKNPPLGIYIDVDKSNVTNMKALIIGPKNTPYEDGYFFFSIVFPYNYPESAPQVKLKTIDGKIRLNPNLYKCGKVCLSILNTWAGEQWTSVCSLTSILLTLQSRFNEFPIINEPGFEKSSKSQKSKDYNKVIQWYNIETAVHGSLVNPPPTFECFYNEIRLELCRHYPQYIKYLTSLYQEDHKVIQSRIYNCKAIYKPFVFASMLTDIYENIYPQYKELLDNTTTTVEENDTNPETSNTETTKTKQTEPPNKKGIRRVPKEKATYLDIGTKMKSETTGDMYIVASRKDGRKMWKKIEAK